MIVGTIDRFEQQESIFVFRGWAHSNEGEKKDPVDLDLGGNLGSLAIRRIVRTDVDRSLELGFEVTCNSVKEVSWLLSGLTWISARNGAESIKLEFWKPVVSKVQVHIPGLMADEKNRDPISRNTPATIDQLKPDTFDPERKGLSTFEIQVGSISADSEVIVGHDSILFLFGGSNKVHSLYSSTINDLDARWQHLFEERDQLANEHRCRYIQTVIPEKQTVLSAHYPLQIDVPTPRLRALEARVRDKDYYVSLVEPLTTIASKGLNPFRNQDTHLSLVGSEIITTTLLSRLGIRVELPFSIGKQKAVLRPGDLGSKILLGHLSESVVVSSREHIDIRLVDSSDPETGHLGAFRHWRNSSPLVKQTVLVFGNSFFERGTDSLMLSGWFASTFDETIFSWSPDVDWDLVKKVKPDILVCQTVERFLASVPLH